MESPSQKSHTIHFYQRWRWRIEQNIETYIPRWCHVPEIYCLPFIKKLITPKTRLWTRRRGRPSDHSQMGVCQRVSFCHKLKCVAGAVNNGPQISSCLIVTLEMYTTRGKNGHSLFWYNKTKPQRQWTTSWMRQPYQTRAAQTNRAPHINPRAHRCSKSRQTPKRPRRDAHWTANSFLPCDHLISG